jgi:hypothetical protein
MESNDVSNNNEASNIEKINEEIRKRIGRPRLADQVQKSVKEAELQNENPFSIKAEAREHPILFALLAFSAIFSASLGIYIALSPRLQVIDGATVVTYQTDLGHILQAILLMVVFVGITEFAFVAGNHYFHKREPGNNAQAISSFAVMAVAIVAIIGTGWAGGSVLASVTSFMTGFVEVPASAQKWIVYGIPLLIAFYTVSIAVYKNASKVLQNRRFLENERVLNEIDRRLRRDTATLAAEEMLEAAEIARYMELVRSGVMSAAEANARVLADTTLGNKSPAPAPDRRAPSLPSSNGHEEPSPVNPPGASSE